MQHTTYPTTSNHNQFQSQSSSSHNNILGSAMGMAASAGLMGKHGKMASNLGMIPGSSSPYGSSSHSKGSKDMVDMAMGMASNLMGGGKNKQHNMAYGSTNYHQSGSKNS